MYCNIILKIDNTKDKFKYSLQDLYNLINFIFFNLNKLELITSIKIFNYSLIFKDLNNNFLIISFNNIIELKQTKDLLNNVLINNFKNLSKKDQIKFINVFYKDINKDLIIKDINKRSLNIFIDLFFNDYNINFKNTRIFLNYLLH